MPIGRTTCLLWTVAIVLGCQPTAEFPARPNVVLIVVDALRAAELSLYGYPRPTSPNLAKRAAESVVFEQARAQAPCTYPSVNSLLTSRHPGLFVGQPEDRIGIPPEIPSIAEMLAAAGYDTAAVTASPIVRRKPTRFNSHGGFDRGFQRFVETCLWGSADCVNRFALELIRDSTGPFFLYLHFMEPHGPYAPPKGWPRPFSDPDFRGPDWAIKGDVNPAERAVSTAGPGAADPRVVAHLRDLYDDEIAYFDEQFGRLLDELEGLGLLDKTLLVLTADHGEQFLEHGQLKHCKDVYDEELRVPMLIRPPGGTSGRRVATAVSNLDVVPTILAWAGGDVTSLAKAPLEGRSLRPLIDETKRSKPDTSGSRSRPPGAAFSAWVGSRAITDGRWKLIYRIPQQRFELYDLWLDPAETIDQAERAPRELRRLRHRLLGWMSDHEDDALGKGTGRLDERARDRLKAVGYLQ